MNFVITNGKDYFCGWDILGNMKFVDDRRLAYRMQHTVAESTLDKISRFYEGYRVAYL